MEDFDSDSRRSEGRHLSRPKRRFPSSDENDPAYCPPGFWINAAKPSGSWKTTSPAKNELGDRNGSEDIDGVVEAIKPWWSPSKFSESKEDASSLSPYDQFKNFHLPRPKFLRYRPDWRSKALTRMRDEESEKEIGRMNKFGQCLSDEEEKYSDVESEEEEEEQENVAGSCGRKGLIKKLGWFILFLLAAWYVYDVDVSEVPTEGIHSCEHGFSSWQMHNFTYEAALENIGAGMMDGLYGEHDVLSVESEHDDGTEVTFGKIEEEMRLNFEHNLVMMESKELSISVSRNSRFNDDNEENSVEINWEDEARQETEGGDELSEFEEIHSPTAAKSHFVPGETIVQKFLNSKEYTKRAEFETHKAQDQPIASSVRMIMLSLWIPFLIASSVFLGMFFMHSSSPNISRSQATGNLLEGQPVVHSSRTAELQSPKEYQTVLCTLPKAPSAVYPKDEKNGSPKHRLAPGIELLGEITFGRRGSSRKSSTVTKLQNTVAEQSINFMCKEKLILEVPPECPFIESPSPGSFTFARKEVKTASGSNPSTPTPLRRSSRLCNRAVQSP